MKDITFSFEEILNGKWIPNYPYDGNGPGVRVSCENENGKKESAQLFTLDMVWDEYMPITQIIKNNDDFFRLYSVLKHSNEMYKLLKSMDDERAKDLISKIDTDKIVPGINFFPEDEDDEE